MHSMDWTSFTTTTLLIGRNPDALHQDFETKIRKGMERLTVKDLKEINWFKDVNGHKMYQEPRAIRGLDDTL